MHFVWLYKFGCYQNFQLQNSLQQIEFQSLSQNPLPCSCSGSEFLYAPCGHTVTGDLNIVRNDKLRDLLRKGPKYREPLIFMTPELRHYHGCMRSVRQTVGEERRCRTRHSF